MATHTIKIELEKNLKRVGPIVLCILDGFGLNKKSRGNAVWLAKTPTLDHLRNNFPSSTLTTFGIEVGLPKIL